MNIKQILMTILISLNLTSGTIVASNPLPSVKAQTITVLSERQFDMDYRYPVQSVSNVFKDNILLNLAYLNGTVKSASDINWAEIQKPFSFKFTLKPNETFAFHDQVLPEFNGKIALTTNARFSKQDGFKTDGLYYGDGVCQLASLISWAAKDANLTVKAPSNHDFAAIPEVPKSEGVAVFYDPSNPSKGYRENLYITNNQDKPVDFNFVYLDGQLKVSVTVNS